MTKVIKVITDNVEGWKLYKTPTKFLLSYNRNSNQYSIPDTIIKIKPSTRVYSYNLINSILLRENNILYSRGVFEVNEIFTDYEFYANKNNKHTSFYIRDKRSRYYSSDSRHKQLDVLCTLLTIKLTELGISDFIIKHKENKGFARLDLNSDLQVGMFNFYFSQYF